jgi:hypothetical protein
LKSLLELRKYKIYAGALFVTVAVFACILVGYPSKKKLNMLNPLIIGFMMYSSKKMVEGLE